MLSVKLLKYRRVKKQQRSPFSTSPLRSASKLSTQSSSLPPSSHAWLGDGDLEALDLVVAAHAELQVIRQRGGDA